MDDRARLHRLLLPLLLLDRADEVLRRNHGLDLDGVGLHLGVRITWIQCLQVLKYFNRTGLSNL